MFGYFLDRERAFIYQTEQGFGQRGHARVKMLPERCVCQRPNGFLEIFLESCPNSVRHCQRQPQMSAHLTEN